MAFGMRTICAPGCSHMAIETEDLIPLARVALALNILVDTSTISQEAAMLSAVSMDMIDRQEGKSIFPATEAGASEGSDNVVL